LIDNEEKIREWFYKYSDEIYNFLLYYTRQSDVDDIIQEVFIKLIHNIDSFRAEANPKTWLYKIARNAAIDVARKNQRVIRKQKRYENMQDAKEALSPEDIMELKESERELVQKINKLKENYRDVLLIKGMKDFSVAETAQILNWSENKVRVTYHRALHALKKEVENIED
jgi:RNA polymerase sigma-70 factor, ECF subfamily